MSDIRGSYVISYYDKNGNGFCGGVEPWFLEGMESIEEAKKEEKWLLDNGYTNTEIHTLLTEFSQEEVKKMIAALPDNENKTSESLLNNHFFPEVNTFNDHLKNIGLKLIYVKM